MNVGERGITRATHSPCGPAFGRSLASLMLESNPAYLMYRRLSSKLPVLLLIKTKGSPWEPLFYVAERSLSSIPTLRDICASMHFRILTTYFSSRVRIRTSTRQSIRAPCGAFLFVWRRERSLRTSLCSRDTCTSMCIGIHTFYRYIEGSNPLLAIHKKGACKPLFYGWRRGRDSNPRYGVTVYTLSRRAPSAARTPLQKFAEYPLLSLATGAVRKRGARLNQMRLECNSGSDQPV